MYILQFTCVLPITPTHTNVNETMTMLTNIPGSKHGLSLVLNIEEYEHMVGPHDDVGIKVCNLLFHFFSCRLQQFQNKENTGYIHDISAKISLN